VFSAPSDFLIDSDALQRVAGAVEETPQAGPLAPFTCPTDTFGLPYLSSVCKASGRASLVYAPRATSRGSWLELPDEGIELLVDEWGEVIQERSIEKKEAANLDRANRRAKSRIKDYVIANDLGMMWTLTYAGEARPDHSQRARVVGDVNAFMKRWRKAVERDFPYLYVLEEHKSGHLHVHLLVPYFFFEHSRLMALWGHGGVNFSRRAKGRSKRDRLRLSGYVTKYVAKQVGDNHDAYDHRYEVAKGFTPERRVSYFPSLADAFDALTIDGFDLVWSSSADPDWTDVPVWVFTSD
jgi:hypothetical protein